MAMSASLIGRFASAALSLIVFAIVAAWHGLQVAIKAPRRNKRPLSVAVVAETAITLPWIDRPPGPAAENVNFRQQRKISLKRDVH